MTRVSNLCSHDSVWCSVLTALSSLRSHVGHYSISTPASLPMREGERQRRLVLCSVDAGDGVWEFWTVIFASTLQPHIIENELLMKFPFVFIYFILNVWKNRTQFVTLNSKVKPDEVMTNTGSPQSHDKVMTNTGSPQGHDKVMTNRLTSGNGSITLSVCHSYSRLQSTAQHLSSCSIWRWHSTHWVNSPCAQVSGWSTVSSV